MMYKKLFVVHHSDVLLVMQGCISEEEGVGMVQQPVNWSRPLSKILIFMVVSSFHGMTVT